MTIKNQKKSLRRNIQSRKKATRQMFVCFPNLQMKNIIIEKRKKPHGSKICINNELPKTIFFEEFNRKIGVKLQEIKGKNNTQKRGSNTPTKPINNTPKQQANQIGIIIVFFRSTADGYK